MTALNSSYVRGDMVRAADPNMLMPRLGRVLAVDGDMLLVDEFRGSSWFPAWWSADVWRRLEPPEVGYYEGEKYEVG